MIINELNWLENFAMLVLVATAIHIIFGTGVTLYLVSLMKDDAPNPLWMVAAAFFWPVLLVMWARKEKW